MTNGDIIRAMTDEELASTISMACPSTKENRCCFYFGKGSNGCEDCWLDWLKKEASDG